MGKYVAAVAGIAACLLALAPGRAAAQGEVASPPDPWVHAATGTRFPAKLGASQRGRVFEYTEDGRDASVGYSIDKDGYRATVTLYVYPTIAGYTCQEVFTDSRSHIEAYEGAQIVSEGTTLAPSGRGGPTAFYARYYVPAGAMREDIPAVRSDVYLYCPPGDAWLVKYRATWSAEVDFASEVEALFHAVDWPANLGG